MKIDLGSAAAAGIDDTTAFNAIFIRAPAILKVTTVLLFRFQN